MKYLVTGGSGLIGRFLIPKLGKIGWNVLDYDIVRGFDVLNWPMTRDAFQRHHPDVVIHLAAQSIVENSKDDPRSALELNIMGTVNVLEACRVADIQNVVVASTNHVYGDAYPPHYEDSPMNGRDIYTASKISADVISQTYAKMYGLNAVAVRPTNTYGPDDPHTSHIIPGTILSILRGEAPVIRSDGKQVKSYMYGEDCADAFKLIAENCERLRGKSINVVGSKVISVVDLVSTIQQLMGSDAEPNILSEPNDLHDEHLDARKMTVDMQWKPQYSLEEGLTKTIEQFTNAQRERANAQAEPVRG